MDPITLTLAGVGGLAALLAGTGHSDLLTPPRPHVSPATARRCAVGAVAATAALGVTAPAAVADDGAWTVTAPTVHAPAPSAPAASPAGTAPPGPANPQAGPDFSTSTQTAPGPWQVSDRKAGVLPPRPPASTPKAAPQAATRHAAPERKATTPKATRRTTHRATVVHRARHVVQPGDTLTGIAAAHRTTVRALVRANTVRHPSLASNPDLILAGWRLRIPGGAR